MNYLDRLEQLLKEEFIKADFQFIYKVIPGMIGTDNYIDIAHNFDGVEVQFLIRLPKPHSPLRRGIKISGEALTNDGLMLEQISYAVSDLRNDLINKLK